MAVVAFVKETVCLLQAHVNDVFLQRDSEGGGGGGGGGGGVTLGHREEGVVTVAHYPPHGLLLFAVFPLSFGVRVRRRGSEDGEHGAYLFVYGDPVFVLVLVPAAWMYGDVLILNTSKPPQSTD